jgi:hypothetical protein
LNSKYEALLRNQEKLMATSKANAIVLPTPVAIVANKKEYCRKESRLLQLILLMI